MVFHWILCKSKSLQVSRTLLSILANLNNAVVWIISIIPLISNSSSLFPSILGPFQVRQLQMVSPLPHVLQLYLSSGKVKVYVYLFAFFYFNTVVL